MTLLASVAWAGTWALVRERREDVTIAVPGPAERAAYVTLVRDVARAAPSGGVPPDASARAEALGLTFVVEPGVAWLMEPTDRKRGGGVVAFRLGGGPGEVVLQAPHPTSDLHTGPIVAALFDAGEVRAACFATVHRRAAEGADPARAADGWLTAATDGLAEGLADPLFVQLHGFGAGTTDADLVVSEGAAPMPMPDLDRARRRFASALDAPDVRLGDEVPALAARTNAQGRLLAGRARFLHVELSLPLRVALDGDPVRRARLAAALRDLAARRAE